ncbi:hypothetical protein Goari_022977, partial [Gossypium aridum]|nr:hypothetical protein [Gossypium aridum]
MEKWSFMLVIALVVVHSSARNVPTTTTVPTSTTRSSVPSGATGVGDQKNFLTYGGVGGYSGIGSNGLPFGGVG